MFSTVGKVENGKNGKGGKPYVAWIVAGFHLVSIAPMIGRNRI